MTRHWQQLTPHRLILNRSADRCQQVVLDFVVRTRACAHRSRAPRRPRPVFLLYVLFFFRLRIQGFLFVWHLYWGSIRNWVALSDFRTCYCWRTRTTVHYLCKWTSSCNLLFQVQGHWVKTDGEGGGRGVMTRTPLLESRAWAGNWKIIEDASTYIVRRTWRQREERWGRLFPPAQKRLFVIILETLRLRAACHIIKSDISCKYMGLVLGKKMAWTRTTCFKWNQTNKWYECMKRNWLVRSDISCPDITTWLIIFRMKTWIKVWAHIFQAFFRWRNIPFFW